MRCEIPLVELLALRAGCRHLSDLHCMDTVQRHVLLRALGRLPAQDAELSEWNVALNYLLKLPPELTPEEARNRLIQSLSALQSRE